MLFMRDTVRLPMRRLSHKWLVACVCLSHYFYGWLFGWSITTFLNQWDRKPINRKDYMKRYFLDLFDCFFMAKNSFFYWYEDHKKLRQLERGEITLDQYSPF